MLDTRRLTISLARPKRKIGPSESQKAELVRQVDEKLRDALPGISFGYSANTFCARVVGEGFGKGFRERFCF
jgi:hypothetical protein